MKTTTKKVRQSNFEALRIVAMLIIVFAHYCGHGIQQQQLNPAMSTLWLSGSLSHRLITLFFLPCGSISVGIFFMLTGYFMCQSEWKPRHLKKLTLETLFYSLCLFALYVVLKGLGIYSFPYMRRSTWANSAGGGTLALLIRSVIPISSGAWWFITAYVILFALIPAINKVTSSLSFKQQLFLTLFFWAFWYTPGCLDIIYVEIRKAVFFYIVGSLLRRTQPKGSKWLFLLLFFLSWLSEFAISIVITEELKTEIIWRLISVFPGAFLNPLACICCFEFFRRLDIPQSKLINTLSSTTLSVYLIHESAVGRELLWNKIFRCLEVQYPSRFYPLLLVATCLAVFMGCAVIDLGRQRLFAALSSRLSHKGSSDRQGHTG